MAIERLPRFSSAKLTLSAPSFGTYERISSPRPGRSILITSAPASASSRLANGPGSSVEKSSTRMPASGCRRSVTRILLLALLRGRRLRSGLCAPLGNLGATCRCVGLIAARLVQRLGNVAVMVQARALEQRDRSLGIAEAELERGI